MRIAFAALAAVLLAGCASGATPAPSAQPPTLAGSLSLTDKGVSAKWDTFPDGHRETTDCYGTGGFADIRVGTPIQVKNESGTIVGAGALVLDRAASVGETCAYTFAFPLGAATFYSVTIGSRAGPVYPAADLAAKGYRVELTLGK